MKDQIISNRQDPVQLEKLYRSNKEFFKKEFNSIYPQFKNSPFAQFWNERLNFHKEEFNWATGRELLIVLLASFLSGVIAKLPEIVGINEEFFYSRNIGFIVFPALASYFAWKSKLSSSKLAAIAVTIITAAVFINTLPNVQESDTLVLSSLHLPVLLWAAIGYAFVGGKPRNVGARLSFLKYNGDLLVISALICIAGGILTGVTIGLFSLLGMNIEEFYFQYIAIFSLPAVPIFGTYLTQTNPHLVGKISPVIARIFSPLVLVMLIIYLVAMVYSGKDPFNDREFLLLFNVLLMGVMAIIFFSVAGLSGTRKNIEVLILILLSVVTIVVNGIALSAILFRISEWGITPNRTAVLGSNLLILINLFMVTAKMLKVHSKKSALEEIGKVISYYLPVYIIWAIIVTFIFPLIFGI